MSDINYYQINNLQKELTKQLFRATCDHFYRFIALPPTTPSTAEATAMTTFRIISQRDLLTAITLHTSFPYAL